MTSGFISAFRLCIWLPVCVLASQSVNYTPSCVRVPRTLRGSANKVVALAYSAEDVAVLQRLVRNEHGDYALSHVSRYVDELREQGDRQAAALWSMVLAGLYHHVEQEREAEGVAAQNHYQQVVLVKSH